MTSQAMYGLQSCDSHMITKVEATLTHSVNKELGFGREVVVDDVIKHRYVDAPSLRKR